MDRMDREVVQAKSGEGWNTSIMQLFGYGPKFTITCGACFVTFRKRVPVASYPGIVCPHCGRVNIIPVIWGGREDGRGERE